MDRREATRVIKELLADRDNDSRYPCVSSPRHYEALDLAIEALVLQDKYVKALERTIEGAKEINKSLEEATAPGNQKQVTSKLKKPCDSLLTADSKACKEQKSKLVSEDVEDMGEVSDGYHTFNQLYHQRAVLFATIVNQNKDKAWKSWKHEDGKFCFDKGGEWFIVGVDTPEGNYTYHYEKKYWDMFDCEELERAKHWDGHTEEDVTRLLSLPPVTPTGQQGHGRLIDADNMCKPVTPKERTGEWIEIPHSDFWKCSCCGGIDFPRDYCPNCGAKMKGEGND